MLAAAAAVDVEDLVDMATGRQGKQASKQELRLTVA